MVSNSRIGVTWPLAVVILSLPSTALEAQYRDLRNTAHIGVGYVASIPITPLGFSALGVTPKILGGTGLYVDFKLTTSSPSSNANYDPNLTIQDAEFVYGDRLFDDKSDWKSFNLALVYAVSGEFLLYGGAGYSKEERYREYWDDEANRGDDQGFYWISDPEGSGDRVNVLGGAIFRLARMVMFQIGGQTEPRSANVGVIFAFPI